MLDFCGVEFKYDSDSKPIIENLNFNVDKGEFVSIIGPSGCGKSTIFRLICSLEKAICGNILVDGNSIDQLKGYIGYMPQKDLLIPWRTISENVCMPLEVGTKTLKNPKQKAEEYLRIFGLDRYKDK